jgi:dihydrodipicolinate synthase/N-acetylneuraminate lyase
VPVKYAASRLGFGDGSLRLPLVEASGATRDAVDAALSFAGLLN